MNWRDFELAICFAEAKARSFDGPTTKESKVYFIGVKYCLLKLGVTGFLEILVWLVFELTETLKLIEMDLLAMLSTTRDMVGNNRFESISTAKGLKVEITSDCSFR